MPSRHAIIDRLSPAPRHYWRRRALRLRRRLFINDYHIHAKDPDYATPIFTIITFSSIDYHAVYFGMDFQE